MEVLLGTLTLGLIALAGGLGLNYATRRFEQTSEEVVDLVNALLPQTQCAQCGHPGCKPYAAAIIQGEAINKCPPGGAATIEALAALLGREVLPPDESCGIQQPPHVVVIREKECIGCTLCIQVCPVDAIVGAPQLMHTVLEARCTGCDLCLEPCPVDCIDIVTSQPSPIPVVAVTRIPQDELELEAFPCIRCGLCEAKCPRDLMPQALYWHRQSLDSLLELDLHSCIECRLCDRVCPSHLPLTEIFATAKRDANLREEARIKAHSIQQRFEFRESRLALSQLQVRSKTSKRDRLSILDSIRADTGP